MYLSVHATIGAIIGNYVPNPVLAFFIGFFGHFLADMIPHGDSVAYKKFKQGLDKKESTAVAAADAVIAITISVLFLSFGARESLSTSAFAIIGSVLPDLLIAIYFMWKTRWLKKFHNFHFFMHDFIVNRFRDWKNQWHGMFFQSIFLMLIVWLASWK